MNQYTLTFEDSQLEKQYYQDQIEELLVFYRWISILGSISVTTFVILEAFRPTIGIGQYIYFLLLLPFVFALSYKFVQHFQNHLNLILASMTLVCGFIVDALLIFYLDKSSLFMAGQVIALVQYSLSIGTNLLYTVIVLVINEGALIFINSYKQQFDSMSLMVIFCIILISKSIQVVNKSKRQFFLTKALNQKLYYSLHESFSFGVAHCEYNPRQMKIKLISQNNNLFRQFHTQQEFTNFIRKFILITTSSSTDKQEKKDITLEQLLHKQFLNQNPTNSQQYLVYDDKQKEGYKVSVIQTISQKKYVLLLLFQQDSQIVKIVKQNKRNQISRGQLQQFLKVTDHCRIILGYTNLMQKFEKIKSPLLSKQKIHLYQMVNRYYNVILQKQFKVGKIMEFFLSSFLNELQNAFNFNKSTLNILNYREQHLKTNYLLLYQLMMNILLKYLTHERKCVLIIYPMDVLDIKCVEFILHFSQLNQNIFVENEFDKQNKFHFETQKNEEIELVNHLILTQIALESKLKIQTQGSQIECSFQIISNLSQIIK